MMPRGTPLLVASVAAVLAIGLGAYLYLANPASGTGSEPDVAIGTSAPEKDALPTQDRDPAPVGSPDPAPSPAGVGEPVRLRIPVLGVNTEVVPVGLTSDGAMAAPPGYDHVGWYKYGAAPGDPGRAVVAGHLDSQNGPAVFWDLKDLTPGDLLLTESASAQGSHSFTVREIAVYEESSAPLQRIFGPSNERELILITCGGTFNREAQDYSHRVVVYAQAEESP